MKLYFSAGKNKRLAIDTERRIWNNNYFYLGGFRQYIKISASDYTWILQEINFNAWDYAEDFK